MLLHGSWLAHLCGLCLALRDEHGQFARAVTNYDGLVISVLVEAQSDGTASRRTAGPCPLRAMRSASVAQGDGARLAAAVSLVLASAKVTDHVDDGDGAMRRPGVSVVARHVAKRWASQGTSSGSAVGFDTAVLLDAAARQSTVELSAASVLDATEPTETAAAAAFAHTAVVSGRPSNAAVLSEAGRLFGRIAHLVDAVEDYGADQAAGAWNPLIATGTSLAEARRHCHDAALGMRLALDEADFVDDRLVRALLVDELDHAIHRAFAHGQDVPDEGGKKDGRNGKKDKDKGDVGEFGAGAADVADIAVSAKTGRGCCSHCDCCDGCC
ncbi:DUF5685 family protein [Kibdelosporangium phytohabitans]|uniref:Uncharacterized protein n=1 Tax=Kibdelosporangium phytohabitans TaxID=860235 RepID=A0A0N9I3M0_9PSEU|nr:hypothetical protein AOZ06_41215 [Kibdelosporangium phytohabitans]MBE1464020.1 hypothetical protein [Kibdelosporangium phytohabitans]